MKAHVSRLDFVQLIGKIQSIVPSKPAIAIFANVLIEADNEQLVLSATDGTLSMKVSGLAQVDEPGAITLPGKRLFQLARELTTPSLVIETVSEDVAVVKAGSSSFKIQGMQKGDFPVFPDLSGGYPLEFKAPVLKEMLQRTAFAAARDDSRQALNGVLMQQVAKHATFIGTDGKRLARNTTEMESETDQNGAYVLPIKAVEELGKVLDDQDVTLTLLPEKLAVESGSVTFITKLLSDQYPDVSRVIPEKTEKAVTLHREELISLLRQVALFTSEASHSVRFSFEEGALHLSAASGEIGEGKVSMPANYSGPKLEIAFNPHNVLDILRHIKDETIQLEVTDPYNPGLVTDSTEAEFVMMPMRLA